MLSSSFASYIAMQNSPCYCLCISMQRRVFCWFQVNIQLTWKMFFNIVYLSCLSLVSPSQPSLIHQNKFTNICIVNNRQQKSKKQIVAIVIILSCRCWHCSCYTNHNFDVIVTTLHLMKRNLLRILYPNVLYHFT